MSKKNRKMMYDKLLAEGRMDQDDGALVKEFGDPENADINYSLLDKPTLRKKCDEKGLTYKSKATKDDLIVLLENKSDGVE